ncbi:MAG: hypothetical protein ABI852_04410, partial [Gemmatimonadaceae bacterium]
MKSIRAAFLVAVFGVTACSSLVTPDKKTATGSISLRQSGAANSLPFTGPYVSVLDSMLLTVTSDQEATPRLIGRHLNSGDTSFILPVTLPAGQATFAVKVLSNNRSLLQSGQASAAIDKEGFSVAVPIVAGRALMVAQPDEITTSFRNAQTNYRTAKAYVYNRGSVNMNWSVKTVDPAFTQAPCAGGRITFCFSTPAVGVANTLKPNGIDSVLFQFPDSVSNT